MSKQLDEARGRAKDRRQPPVYLATRERVSADQAANLGAPAAWPRTAPASAWWSKNHSGPIGLARRSTSELFKKLVERAADSTGSIIIFARKPSQHLVLRFAKRHVRAVWNVTIIDQHPDSRSTMKLGVGHRGSSMTPTRAPCATCANHLFQLLSLFAMEQPAGEKFDAHSVPLRKRPSAGRDHPEQNRKAAQFGARQYAPAIVGDTEHRGCYRRTKDVNNPPGTTETLMRR